MFLKSANVLQVKQLVKKLNTEIQLRKDNIDSTGTKLSVIGGPYSTVTLILDPRKKGPNDIDLYSTGEFQNSFLVFVTVAGITITADTQKDEDDLTDRWGENIIGLTDENIQKVSEIILENYQKEVRKFFGI